MSDGAYLLYDGECPVCKRLVLWSGLKAAHPDILLINARDRLDLVAEHREAGREINDGIVLKTDDGVLFGDAALAEISRLAQDGNEATRWPLKLLTNNAITRWTYPVMKAGRALLLRLMGRSMIDR